MATRRRGDGCCIVCGRKHTRRAGCDPAVLRAIDARHGFDPDDPNVPVPPWADENSKPAAAKIAEGFRMMGDSDERNISPYEE